MRVSGTARVSIGCRPAGFSVKPRDIHVAEIGKDKRARDRRRGHDQGVGRGTLSRRAPAADARRSDAARRRRQTELLELDAGLEEGVRADDDPGSPGRDFLKRCASLCDAVSAGEEHGLIPAASASGAMVEKC